jgi:hypothetical protein
VIDVPAYTGRRSLVRHPVDILFVNLSNWPGRPVYPYAFVQVSALARQAGLSVVRWDGLGLRREHQLECIAHLVAEHRPRAVAFTIRQSDSTIASDYEVADGDTCPKHPWFPVEDTRAAIQLVREVSDAAVLVGGFTFTVNPVSAAEYLQPDLGVVGEPDEFLDCFDQVLDGRTHGVSNLLYRADGQWRRNQRVFHGPLADLEYTEEIVDELFRFHGERVLRSTHLADVPGLNTADDTGRSIAIEISRGCPAACAFCCEPAVKGRAIRLRPLDVVEAEIRNLLRYGLRYYWFVCSELNFTRDHVLELAERLIRINESQPRPIYWRSYFLPVRFDKDELRILMRSGLLLEQNGPFSDLSDQTLRQMREPYRAKHALRHIKDLIALNQEPEFQSRKMSRWILWSWLWNPFATLESVRSTLHAFSAEGLDLLYDQAEGYPALRVYECLDRIPEEARRHAIVVTGSEATPKSLVHPAFYYSRDLVEHFGGIPEVHRFQAYAHDTMLSRRYRTTRDWPFFARSLGSSGLRKVVAPLIHEDLDMVTLPPWIDHPDLGDRHPRNGKGGARVALDIGGVEELAVEASYPEGDAVLSFLLHAAFAVSRHEMAELFEWYDLPVDGDGFPPASPFRALSTLLQCHDTESSLLADAEKRFCSRQVALLRYYLYAIDVRLEPKHSFLAAPLAEAAIATVAGKRRIQANTRPSTL